MKLLLENGQADEYSNTYIAVDDVDKASEYMVGFDKWTGFYNKQFDFDEPAITDEEKISVLIQAGMLLNIPKYYGELIYEDQGMQFPRNFNNQCIDPNVICCSGQIPKAIKKAQLLLVRDILMGDIDTSIVTGRSYNPKVKSIYNQQGGSITFEDGVALSQSDGAGFVAVNSDPLYSIRKIIKPFVQKSVQGINLVRL